MPLRNQICKMFEPMTDLGCSITILLLANFYNMSLDYLYFEGLNCSDYSEKKLEHILIVER